MATVARRALSATPLKGTPREKLRKSQNAHSLGVKPSVPKREHKASSSNTGQGHEERPGPRHFT
eukprot:2001673-Alexandrium_andersonii.AAC.1